MRNDTHTIDPVSLQSHYHGMRATAIRSSGYGRLLLGGVYGLVAIETFASTRLTSTALGAEAGLSSATAFVLTLQWSTVMAQRFLPVRFRYSLGRLELMASQLVAWGLIALAISIGSHAVEHARSIDDVYTISLAVIVSLAFSIFIRRQYWPPPQSARNLLRICAVTAAIASFDGLHNADAMTALLFLPLLVHCAGYVLCQGVDGATRLMGCTVRSKDPAQELSSGAIVSCIPGIAMRSDGAGIHIPNAGLSNHASFAKIHALICHPTASFRRVHRPY